MAEETQYKANTGLATISVANTSLTGSGNIIYPTASYNTWTVLTAGLNGTLITTVRIKAQGNPSQGMIRLWIYDGSSFWLLQEVVVYPKKQSGPDTSFEWTVNLDYELKTGYSLMASTQNADTFNIIAEGLDFTYFRNYVRPESANYINNTGIASISTGTSSMTGSGSTLLLTAPSGMNGTAISSINIKSTAATTADGMVRIFIYNGSSYFLFTEVFIPFRSQSGIYKSYEYKLNFPKQFRLKAGYSLYVSTQNSDAFRVIAEGIDWSYPEGPYQSNFTPVSFGGDTSEHLLHSYQIPSGLFQAGDLLGVYASGIITNNNHNRTFRIYLNSLANGNTLSGATLIGLWIGAFSIGTNMQRMFPIINNTTLECFGGTANTYPNTRNQYGTTTTTSGNVTFSTGVSAGFWLLISGQDNSTADTNYIRWSMVGKIF